MTPKEVAHLQDPERLCRTMEEKVEALKRYLLVTQGLRECLESNNLEGMKTMLAQRQDLIRIIEQTTANMKRVDVPGWADKFFPTAPIQERWNFLYKSAQDLLQKTASVDAECLARVSCLRDKLREELRERGSSVKARRAYAQHSSPDPRFMDVEH